MGRALQGRKRLTYWHEAKKELTELLERYGLPGSTPSPEFPFAALHRSSLWTLENLTEDVPQARGSRLRPWLDQHNPLGGLELDLYNLLAKDSAFRERAVCSLLQTYFTDTPWEEILCAVGLQDEPFDGFGPPPYVPIGTTFPNRDALAAANIHRPLQGGIWGKQNEEAKSIVVSGGYADDEDYGSEIIYTGQGGVTAGRHTHDQTLTRGNSALVNSAASGTPVRVIRGAGRHSEHAPHSGLRYDGLYRVEDYWSERRREDGHRIWRYRLRAVNDTPVADVPAPRPPLLSLSDIDSESEARPGRRQATIQRIIRSTQRANRVKRLHDYTCQVCGIRIDTPTGAYAEAAHIKPLGRPHNGPDRTDNILCLCPNHHVAFDFGMLTIEEDGSIRERGGESRGKLRTAQGHVVNPDFLGYHRDHHDHRES